MKTKMLFPSLLLIVVLLTTGIFVKEDYTRSHPSVGGPIVIRLAHVANETSPIHLQALKLKELMEERSDGRFEVQIFPNAQLGGDRQATESAGLGILTASFPGTAILAGFEPKFMVGDLPFIFESRDAAYSAFDNELGQALNELLIPLNMVNMGYSETGFRHITNSKHPVITPDDLKGIKIRTMENSIHMASFEAWGANPTPMSFSELFTALQQKTIDAEENPLQIIASSRFYEVQDYLTLSGHFFASGSLLFNKTFVDNLPEDLRDILEECTRESTVYGRSIVASMEKDFLEELIANGMQVVELTPEQKSAFVEAAQPVYKEFEPLLGKELIEMAQKYNGRDSV